MLIDIELANKKNNLNTLPLLIIRMNRYFNENEDSSNIQIGRINQYIFFVLSKTTILN